MDKKDLALNMAIEALQNIDNWLPTIGQRGLRDYEADALKACKEALAQSDKNTLYLPVKIDKHGFIFNMQPLFDAGIQGKFKIKLEVCDE